MRTPEEIDAIMALIPNLKWRSHWCVANPCSCIGGANCSGWQYIHQHNVTREEHAAWLEWKQPQEAKA